jgi:uncharacterized protein YbjT (DUF2867 family)
MTSRILVTGGTGTLGRHVVPRLRDAGCDVRVLSRRTANLSKNSLSTERRTTSLCAQRTPGRLRKQPRWP